MAKSANQTFFAKFKLNRDLYILLLIGGLYALATFLSNTFVNVFLWRQAGDYITIASYNLATFFFHFLSCLVAGKLVKKDEPCICSSIRSNIFGSFFIL